MTQAQKLLVERAPVSILTLNRPECHNAIDTEMGGLAVEALRQLGQDPSVKAIVIRGVGPSFSSGDDRKAGGGVHGPDTESLAWLERPYLQLLSIIRRVPRPVIAQVHGYCLAAGMDVMLACDFAIADEDARFGMLFGHIGLAAGAVYLPRYLGLKRGMKLLFHDGIISAGEACELGLISEVAPRGELEERVASLAGRLADEQQRFYGHFGTVKEAVNRVLFPALDEDIRLQALMLQLSDFYRDAHPLPDGSVSNVSWPNL